VISAGIDVGHHRDGAGAHNIPSSVEHVLHFEQADVGLGEQATGEAETADLNGFDRRPR